MTTQFRATVKRTLKRFNCLTRLAGGGLLWLIALDTGLSEPGGGHRHPSNPQLVPECDRSVFSALIENQNRQIL
jgi:hypothetical protein